MPGNAVLIGRVGALAVALGVGVAIAGTAGTAAADTTESGGGGTQTESRPERESTASGNADGAPESGKADPGDASPRDTELENAASDTDTDSDSAPAAGTGDDDAGPARTSAGRLPRTLTVRTADLREPADDYDDDDYDDDEPDPGPSPADVAALTALGAARREVGSASSESSAAVLEMTDRSTPQAVVVAAASPLGTPQQLAAEQLAQRIAGSVPVQLARLFLKAGFYSAAQRQFDRVDGPDPENLRRLDAAVDAYAMGAAFQQQLLNSAEPTVVMQVAPPHTWYGQSVGASRILYDNPDTIYRFMGVNGASSYVIRGTFADLDNLPADTSFSVLTGLTGNTAAVLTKDQLVIEPDGSFTITADASPAGGRTNHLQLTAETTLIATRNTLSDWARQTPMSLEITRVGGPPNSLFSQLGGFAIPGIGPAVVRNPVLTTLVSLIPPLPYVPTVLRGTVAAVIMLLGVQREETYMRVATTDPGTGERIDPNVLKDPARNAEFLATQLQSAGYFQLADDQALVITVRPGGAGYFVVPVTDDWTVTDDYWNVQTSLNNAQAVADDADGTTYTLVLSPTDPGVANWVSTGGLNQGTISIRFQDLDPDAAILPSVDARLVRLEDLPAEMPPGTRWVTGGERAAQLAGRKAAYDLRFAPYPQA
ncbi:hypothetical protein O6072_18115 [Mycolicibacterium neoaurum]|uniref:hypothetical protein n=1 Tax=Mycolicibacterium neoaurum TaxID=1795 RepID=UPI00248A8F41|nr:hypothetical protein [Mycolicibacterium neoaurum]WBP93262.1 hypothetical protein O7W24_19130 [Mycolicibacterium neoaurum]WBS06771.1 hypothetical protein O6072_18115 [Mycolicibacterium neoaurum]